MNQQITEYDLREERVLYVISTQDSPISVFPKIWLEG